MNDDQKRAFFAVILSGVILFGWQYFYAKNYSNESINNPEAKTQMATNEASTTSSTPGAVELSEASKVQENESTSQTVVQKFVDYEGKYSIGLNSFLHLLDFKSASAKFDFPSIIGQVDQQTGQNPPLEIQFLTSNGYRSLYFNLEENNNSSILKGTNPETNIQFSSHFDKNGKFNFQIVSPSPQKIRFVFHSKAQELQNHTPREFLAFSNEVERFEVGEEERGEGNVKWVGIDFNYHLFALIFANKEFATYQLEKNGVVIIELGQSFTNFNGSFVFTKKNYDELIALGDNLKQSVDFGFWGVLAVPILRGLQFFYRFIPNYGWAIIFLTLLVRLITFPLQYKSFQSMKKMQVIQPELAKIRERFKEDPQRMQKETMELFKRAGANPLGGCLPLLLQMPVFFAFYKVLYEAVELVGAPFFGWIHDLSAKDPYYILPVLMSITMFIQQKMTPATTADPTQKKIMLFMPLILGLIMKDLPSGLTLYILVSTLFGILQQLFVYKQTPA